MPQNISDDLGCVGWVKWIRKDPRGIGRELSWLSNGAVHSLMNHLTSLKHRGGIHSKHSNGSSESVSGLTHGLVIPKSILIIQLKPRKLLLQSNVTVLLESTEFLALDVVCNCNISTSVVKTLESNLALQHPKVCRTKHSAHRRHSGRNVESESLVLSIHDVFFIPFLVYRRCCCELVELDFLESGLNHRGRHPKSFDGSGSHSGCISEEGPSQVHSEVAVVSDHPNPYPSQIKSLHLKLLANKTVWIRNLRAVAHLFCSFFEFENQSEVVRGMNSVDDLDHFFRTVVVVVNGNQHRHSSTAHLGTMGLPFGKVTDKLSCFPWNAGIIHSHHLRCFIQESIEIIGVMKNTIGNTAVKFVGGGFGHFCSFTFGGGRPSAYVLTLPDRPLPIKDFFRASLA